LLCVFDVLRHRPSLPPPPTTYSMCISCSPPRCE
jgi:hypothetical protein